MDSFDFVTDIIYDKDGNFKHPTKMLDLYYHIQTLVYLYKNNPEWPRMVKDDIMRYVQECTDLLEKM